MVTPCDSRPTVQLRHDLPDGSSHVDWMIAQDPRGATPLLTFRVAGRVDELACDGEPSCMAAERIADHRPAYLTYEGPVSGDRGFVRRLARGEVVAYDETEEGWEIAVVWESACDRRRTAQHLRVIRRGGDRWEVRAV